uniref:Uncharacterized protein n=1 Tax=Anguilla anguilla TaxID=7936 RepID=A0A0E9T8C5_ANGAN
MLLPRRTFYLRVKNIFKATAVTEILCSTQESYLKP